MQFRSHDFSAVGSAAEQIDMLFSDKELKLLLLWALVSPMAGVSYLLWIKYPKLRLLAIFAFAVALIQFAANVPLLIAFFKQFGVVLRI
ncbi:MAG: hypothetical protein AABX01_06815 [Candidatus Micrarchaeota archaeon]